MPDPNKFEALRKAGFKVRPTCRRCVHFSGGSGWGTCAKIPYDHLKHTGPARYASVPVDGWCPSHKFHKYHNLKHPLGAHEEFVDE